MLRLSIKSAQDFAAGLIFVVTGLAGLWFGWNYAVGTIIRMGPGYMPRALHVILIGIGLFLIAQSLVVPGEAIRRGRLRPHVFILAAIILFGLMIERFGLIPSIFFTTIVASLASSDARWVEAVALAAALAVASALLFVKLLGQPIELFSWNF